MVYHLGEGSAIDCQDIRLNILSGNKRPDTKTADKSGLVESAAPQTQLFLPWRPGRNKLKSGVIL